MLFLVVQGLERHAPKSAGSHLVTKREKLVSENEINPPTKASRGER